MIFHLQSNIHENGNIASLIQNILNISGRIVAPFPKCIIIFNLVEYICSFSKFEHDIAADFYRYICKI